MGYAAAADSLRCGWKRKARGIASAAVALACETEPRAQLDLVSVRDSAGVRIVEHRGLPAELATWRIAETPDLSIGTIADEGPDLFGQLVDVVELSGGVLVSADAQALELRAFARNGAHLWTAGRRGGGPGEFTRLVRLAALPGDSVLASDGRSVSVFDRAGGFVRRAELIPPSDDMPAVIFLGALQDGRLVAQVQGAWREFGRSRGSIALTYHGPEGAAQAMVAELAGTERVRLQQGQNIVQGDAVFGRRTEFAVGGGSVAVTTQETFEVRRYGPAGMLEQVLRVQHEPVIADARVRDRLGVAAGSVHLPDTLPAIGRIHLDSERRFWVEEYVPRTEDREPSWWVFDPDGEILAQATLPPNFSIRRIDADRVLGIGRDDLGVHYIQVRQIVRDVGAIDQTGG